MPKFAAIKSRLPIFCSVSGAILLLGAWPIALMGSYRYSDYAYALAVMLWAVLPLTFMGMYVRPHVSAMVSSRFLMLFTLFTAGMITFTSDHYRNITAQALSMAGVFLLVLGLPAWKRAHPLLAKLDSLARRHEALSPRTFATGGFIFFLGLAVSLSAHCFSFLPSYTDSMAQYVHAKFVAGGHLFYVRDNPLHEFFPVWLMVNADGKWYSQYPPLHQTLLGIGYFLGTPWLINPLEGALTLVTVYTIARRDYSENAARIACVLMLLSPFIMLMSSEYMNHASSLLFTTLMIYSYGELQAAITAGDKRKTRLWALATGLCSGCVFLTRPLTGVAVTLPFAASALWNLRKNRAYLSPCLTMAAAGAACVAFQLWYNLQTTGNLFTYAYTRYHVNSLGSAMGYHGDHFLEKAITKMRAQWFAITIALYEWSLPCVFFVFLACSYPIRHPTTRLLLAMLISQTLVDMLNQFTNYTFGPRYLYETSTQLVILTAVGICELPKLLGTFGRLENAETARGMAISILLMVCTTGLYRIPVKINEYSHLTDSHPEFYYQMLEQSQHPALIFLGRANKNDPQPAPKFRWIAWMNPQADSAPVMLALDRGDERNRALIQHYPNRKIYFENNGKLIPATPPAPHE